ncbi:unnamed protein product [Lupinus luteus]|uniref:Uncharacterized protein n=1 Tax=Lupinus luteus TaxID=3873 RepID=A0AAV1XD79_LUPLU
MVCLAGVQFIGKVSPGFEGAQLNWVDNDGMFLISDNGGELAFCFITNPNDTTKLILGVVHVATSTLKKINAEEASITSDNNIVK